MTVRVGVSGAAGRMGRSIINVVRNNKNTSLTAAIESPQHPEIGADWPGDGVVVADSFIPDQVDVFIDFSAPAATLNLARQCRPSKTALVVGTTGFSESERAELSSAAADIALVVAPNMSAGVNALFALAAEAAKMLRGYDMEIFEAHHRNKKDAPSGTALRLGEVAAAAAGQDFAKDAVLSRQGRDNERRRGEIGFSVLRGGDIVGEHKIVFAGEGEQLEIFHRSTSRINFAAGAVAAAEFAARAAAGEYDMRAVLRGA